MTHDFSIVFDTDNHLWQRVLEIFAKNEKFEKKIVKNRNLHHKFPRSFSKALGEEVDNDKDNLISLSLADHFLVHYYYYLLAKKGYRSSMALAFRLMGRKAMKYISPETAEAIAKDYEEAKSVFRHTDETKAKISKASKGHAVSEEMRNRISEANSGVNNGMYGKHHEDTSVCISLGFKGHKHSDESKLKMRDAKKGKKQSAERKANTSAIMKEWWRKRKMERINSAH